MDIVRKSKKLSWLLRHGAVESGLSMDEAGWTDVADVLRLTRLTEAQLDQVVAENNKSRLQRVGDRIRAAQGHSIGGVPVTLEGLESSWERPDRADPLVHGTRIDLLDGILRHGLLPMRRTHVHLADAPDSKVGKRAGVDVLVEVDPARLAGVWLSPNGVWLTREVPPTALIGVVAVTARARASEVVARADQVLRGRSRG